MIYLETDIFSLDIHIKTGLKSCRHFCRDLYSTKSHYFQVREVTAINPLQPDILVHSSGRTLSCITALILICF